MKMPLKEQEPVNLYARKYEMACLRAIALAAGRCPAGQHYVPRVLNMFDRYPYWFTLLTALGFLDILARAKNFTPSGIDTISSQSVCYPAQTGPRPYSGSCQQRYKAHFLPPAFRMKHRKTKTRINRSTTALW